MLPEGLRALLILQERDTRRSQLEKILAQIPREQVTCEAHISTHRTGIDAARKAVNELELRRKDLESTIRGLEDQVARYKTQQMSVKKNDEYQALTHEIELAEGKIGEAEEAEIQLLYDLDAERTRARGKGEGATRRNCGRNRPTRSSIGAGKDGGGRSGRRHIRI